MFLNTPENGMLAQHKLLGDLAVGFVLCDQPGDFLTAHDPNIAFFYHLAAAIRPKLGKS